MISICIEMFVSSAQSSPSFIVEGDQSCTISHIMEQSVWQETSEADKSHSILHDQSQNGTGVRQETSEVGKLRA